MRWIILFTCVVQFLIIHSKVIPDYLPQFCSQSDPNYNECTTKTLSKLGPHLLKGIRAINFPKFHPLNVPLFVANRTISEDVKIYAVCKNTQIWGFNTTYIKSFKFDPNNKQGELHLHVPYLKVAMEYEVIGQLLSLNIENAGFFKGNATDIELIFKFSLKPIDKLGVQYYTLDDFKAKSTIGNGYVKMTSKDPNFQFAADLITNFFNENPRRTIDAVQPIYEESVEVFYKRIADEVLNSIPADELLPKYT